MKKIIIMALFLFNISCIYAIEDIEINNEYLIPEFDKSVKVYNYFTTSDTVKISVSKADNESIYGEGLHNIKKGENTFEIVSSNNEKYVINVFKDYEKDNSKGYLKSLNIEGYNLNFNNNKHVYYINIDNEEYLNFDYVLSNDNVKFSISGNGNFNKSDNIITIIANDEKYIIHALKTVKVNNIVNNDYKEMSSQKKEITIILLIIISCILIGLYYYSLFVFN